MRPNTVGSLRWVAAGALLLSGCYRPWMQPNYGNGSPMYGNQYQGGYGGYQGIQTLTPGQYYDPGSTVPGTYAPNNLQPTPDTGSSGIGGGGANDGGGDATPYSPGVDETPSKPVPNDPYYKDNETGAGAGSGLVPPETEGPVNQQKINLDNSSSQSDPAPVEDWATPTIEQASGMSEAVESTDATETVKVPATETTDTETTAEEEPPLTIP